MRQNKSAYIGRWALVAPLAFGLLNPVAEWAATALSCACPWRAVNRGRAMFCTACGTSADDAARYCGHCGKALATPTRELYYAAEVEPAEAPAQQPRPWVRYWARTFDVGVFGLICGLLLYCAITPENAVAVLKFSYVFFGFGMLVLWVFVEALFISTFGATPGKSLLRTQVVAIDGSAISYKQALSRSASVWWRGLAAGIPLVSAGTMVHAYSYLKKNGGTSWDKEGGLVVRHEHIGPARVTVAIIFILGLAIFASATRMDNSKALMSVLEEERQASLAPIQATQAGTAPTPGPSETYSPGTPSQPIAPVRWGDRQPAAPASGEASESARWGDDVVAYFNAHPSLYYRQNATIMQRKIDTLTAPGMTNRQILDTAFYAAEADSEWSNGP